MPEFPTPYSTFDGTLTGQVDGLNRNFAFTPFQRTLLYSTPNVTNAQLFRNGVLIDEPADYTQTPGAFTLPQSTLPDTITARLYQGGGASKIRMGSQGLTASGNKALCLTTPVPFMLFRNGILLTKGLDYTVSGQWIVLMSAQYIQPGDAFFALIGTGGIECDTNAGTINGAVNGANPLFTMPAVWSQIMLFRNGVLLTEGLDFTRQSPNQVVIFSLPLTGDILTAQLWTSGGPLQVTNFDGTLAYAQATQSMLFRNGLMMTQPLDGLTALDLATLVSAQTPVTGDTVTVRAYVPNILDAALPTGPIPFNLPKQYSTNDGSLIGAVNGMNTAFTVATGGLVTSMFFSWNGDMMTVATDYMWACLQNSSAGPWVTTITFLNGQIPSSGDTLTALVFSQ